MCAGWCFTRRSETRKSRLFPVQLTLGTGSERRFSKNRIAFYAGRLRTKFIFDVFKCFIWCMLRGFFSFGRARRAPNFDKNSSSRGMSKRPVVNALYVVCCQVVAAGGSSGEGRKRSRWSRRLAFLRFGNGVKFCCSRKRK